MNDYDFNKFELSESDLNNGETTHYDYPEIREYDSGNEVLILQEKLKALNFFAGSITGSFDYSTKVAAQNFQSAYGLEETGIIDEQTWEMLFVATDIFNIPNDGSILNFPTIRLGDSGEYVRMLQQSLVQLLFYDGNISGNFDSKTQSSVKAFQINNKLTADGIVGRNTWSALVYLYSPLAICGGLAKFRALVIDAGHGGDDPGAVSSSIIEKEFTLKISQYMNNRFREMGVPVAMTRTSDETLSREERIKRMVTPFGDTTDVIVISNHINAGGGEGAEVIYALRNTPEVAQTILDELGRAGQKKRSVYQRTLPDDPTKDYYYIMRDTKNTATTIVEYGFLDNNTDIAKLQKYWDIYAEAVVKAVMQFMNYTYNPPGSGNIKYVVKAGDSLWAIANKFNTTVDAIMMLNNMTSTSLSIGQQLLIPGENVEPSPPAGNIVYVVKSGDSLWSIAKKFETTVDELVRINKLTSTNLAIGQQLFVPGVSIEIPDPSLTVYTVVAGDTLSSIARKFSTSTTAIIDINNLTSDILQIGQRLIIPRATTIKYIVRSGDSLWSIANRHNTTVDEIKRLNGLTSNLLSIGQELLIPVSGEGFENFEYIVKSGDSLWSIANMHNTTVDEIKRLNNLTSDRLAIGQILLIPIR